ncbi:hypothetical protein HU200_041977 [Digitaria exilis]|uniref:Uncharacterized protein n=1 Tax=Digitaria exilis TaxID=1010633 RepID=A0A835EF30_9POAL|nr:hypothetical protein HU200_041977 [Digitaria exilis]CAB3495183.1 unnamed protein product [Digitaria exilis]
MVKIADIEEKRDVSSDDDECIEIGPAEFVKKLNLKETDDVVLIAAKGKIVKVEVDHPEGVAKVLYGFGSEANHKHVPGGDCIDSPYKIDEDEMSLLKAKIEDMFVIDKPSAKLHGADHKDSQFFCEDQDETGCDTANILHGKLVVKLEPGDSIGVEVIPDKTLAKCEPVGNNGVECAADEEGSYDHCLDISTKRIFDEEDDDDVVVV